LRTGGRAPVDAPELVVREVLAEGIEVAAATTDGGRPGTRLQHSTALQARHDLVAPGQRRVDLHWLDVGQHRLSSGQAERPRRPDGHRPEPEAAMARRLDLGVELLPGLWLDVRPIASRGPPHRRQRRVMDRDVQRSPRRVVDDERGRRGPAQPQDAGHVAADVEVLRARSQPDVHHDEGQDGEPADAEHQPRRHRRNERRRADDEDRQWEPPSEVHGWAGLAGA
jgi:hypothetical protein